MGDPALEGRWLGVVAAPGDESTVDDGRGVYGVHGALLRTGRVILWSGSVENSRYFFRSWSWDPATFNAGPLTGVIARWFLPDFDAGGSRASPPGPEPTLADDPDADLFCAHHVVLEDGTLLAVGGTREPFSAGAKGVFLYDPMTERWRPPPTDPAYRLQAQRWYPTAVMLSDGRVAVFSGRPSSGLEASSEILSAPDYRPVKLSGGDRRLYIYPGMVLAPGGAVFTVPTSWQYEGASNSGDVLATLRATASVRVSGTSAAWTEHVRSDDPSRALLPDNFLREEGTFVLLPPAHLGRVLLIGGGFALSPNDGNAAAQQSTQMDTCEILETQGTVTWRPAGTMRRPRSNVNAVLLPDGKVLIVGGHDGAKRVHATDQLVAELYDPAVAYNPADPHAAFTDMAAMGSSRLYHSVALLLPDGRVLVAGGEDEDHAYPHKYGSGLHSMEFFEPPYCHRGARPTLTRIVTEGPADEVFYGGGFVIETPEAASIGQVVLMRPGSVTHHTDTQQRHVPLSFALDDMRLRVALLDDPSVAPPGYYMVFILDDQGRPCARAAFVRLSHRKCVLITDRSTYSVDEMEGAAPTSFPAALYVTLEGFLPSEIGLTSATPGTTELTALAPAVTFHDGATREDRVIATPARVHLEDPSLPSGLRQRVTIAYTVTISSLAPFPAAGGGSIDSRPLSVRAEFRGWKAAGSVRLVRQANPYLLDGPTHWLSTDLRVFKVRVGAAPFGFPLAAGDPLGFVRELITRWNDPALAASHPFDGLTEDPNTGSLQIAREEDGERVFNFAVARVRYLGKTLPATDVRVFFRAFATAATNFDYDESTTYRRHKRASGEVVPLLGVRGAELASIPFFATPRVDTALLRMQNQPEDLPNRQTFAPVAAGGEARRYFAAYLDINQTEPQFPRYPGASDGPFLASDALSIQQLIMGRHQCLVAEANFVDDPIATGANPANDDNLSQRNLVIEGSDNPGGPEAHTLALSFEVLPTWNAADGKRGFERTFMTFAGRVPMHTDHAPETPRRAEPMAVVGTLEHAEHDHNHVVPDDNGDGHDGHDGGAGKTEPIDTAFETWTTPVFAARPMHHEHAAPPQLRWLTPDELFIDWGSMPRGSLATLYLPGLRADDVLTLLRRRWADDRFERIDDHTLRFAAQGLTQIPLPTRDPRALAGLLTVELPDTVRVLQSFVVRVRQVSTQQGRIVGTFELRIPVSTGERLLAAEVRWLAVLRHILQSLKPADRFRPVLLRLERVVAERVRAFGRDPATVKPSPDGCCATEPCRDPTHDHGGHDHGGHDHGGHDHDHQDPPQTCPPTKCEACRMRERAGCGALLRLVLERLCRCARSPSKDKR